MSTLADARSEDQRQLAYQSDWATVGLAEPEGIHPLMRLVLQNWLFVVLFSLATGIRFLAVLGYPAVWFEDSFEYVGVALRMQPYPVRPSGYSFLLWMSESLHSFAFVVVVQHLMGLAMGAMTYAVIRRRARHIPRRIAALAAAPVLLDAYQIFFEQAILSDVLFSLLVLTALIVILWTPTMSIGRSISVGLLIAGATLTRSIGLVLLPLVIIYLLVGRSDWRRITALAIAMAIPLGGYAVWYSSWHGNFSLNGGSGVWLWARTMPFADCGVIKPPVEVSILCPTQPPDLRPSSPYFIWSEWSPLRRVPGHPIVTRADLFNPERDRLAGDFARRAILSQPLDYLYAVGSDLRRTFNWRRGPNPNSSSIGYNRYAFPNVNIELPDEVRIPGGSIRKDLESYEKGPVSMGFSEPWAMILRTYQTYVFMPGPVFCVIAIMTSIFYSLALLSPHRRKAVKVGILPLVVGATLTVGPVVVTAYDSRYWLPAIPMFCMALAFMAGARRVGADLDLYVGLVARQDS
jgi:hypothetical protein